VFDDSIDVDLPRYVAAGSVGMHIAALLFRLLIEYSVLWSMDARLGDYVCSAFKEELDNMEMQYSAAKPTIITAQVFERAKWEYVARAFGNKYRFDVVFRANRFGQIFQTIQGKWKVKTAANGLKGFGKLRGLAALGGLKAAATAAAEVGEGNADDFDIAIGGQEAKEEGDKAARNALEQHQIHAKRNTVQSRVKGMFNISISGAKKAGAEKSVARRKTVLAAEKSGKKEMAVTQVSAAS